MRETQLYRRWCQHLCYQKIQSVCVCVCVWGKKKGKSFGPSLLQQTKIWALCKHCEDIISQCLGKTYEIREMEGTSVPSSLPYTGHPSTAVTEMKWFSLPMHPLLLCILGPKSSVILAQLFPSQWNCPAQSWQLRMQPSLLPLGSLACWIQRSIVLVITLGLREMILQLWSWLEVSFGGGMHCFLEITSDHFVFTSEWKYRLLGQSQILW